MAEAIVVFNKFVHDVKRGSWIGKAKAVKELETYFRESLAVDKNSFSFLNDKDDFSDCKIRWKIGGEFTDITWVRLLKPHGWARKDSLGVLRKDDLYLKTTLNRLKKEFGGW